MRIAIGLPSYQEAASIAHVTSEVDAGLLRIAEPADCIIINADGESPDATARVFLETPTRCRKQSLITTPHRGKGSNIFSILRYCREHEIVALAFIDTDLRSIIPDWIGALLNPVLQGEADYVTPLYLRRRFEGATTNHFAYPILTAYFGQYLRQPIGGEFGLSGAFLNYLLKQPVNPEILGYGIDIFMTMHAVGGMFKTAQASLGHKVHSPSFAKRDRIFPEVVTSALTVARQYRMSDRPIDSAPVQHAIDDRQESLNEEQAREAFAESQPAAKSLIQIYEDWLGEKRPEVVAELIAEEPNLSAPVWAELAAACAARGIMEASEVTARTLADQLYHLWVLRSLTFSRRNLYRTPAEIEAEVEWQRRLFTESLRARITRG
jgi:glycosyltransferase involved in cell wall biosynthesis